MNRSFIQWILVFLLVFLSIGAFYGGILLTISPSGEMLQMPLENLRYSPFPDYLIPGLFLIIFLGVIPLFISAGIIYKFECKPCDILNFSKKIHWSIVFSMYIGIILMLFEIIQVILFRSIYFLHVIYFILGLVILMVSMSKNLRKE